KFLQAQKQNLLTSCLFLIATALLFGIFSQFQPPAVTKPVPDGVRVVDYSTFVGQVKAGNVLAVIMQGDDIHGLLAHPFLVHSSTTRVVISSQRDATDITAWSRYVRAGYPSRQAQIPVQPPIDP